MPEGYNYKVDVWAFGSIFYQLFTTKPPFDKYDTAGKNKFDLARAVMEGTWRLPERYRDKMSMQALNIIHRCLVHEPADRISFE